MKQNEPSLTSKQEAAIAALLTEPSREDAAKKVGISRSTLTRWLADPAFQTAYQTARAETVQTILTALQSASIQAIATLREVMTNTAAGASARVSAAKAVLDNLLRSREQLEFEERLKAIEEGLPERNKS